MIFLKLLIITIFLISLTNGQALLQGMNHPLDAQGWGLQAISTFSDKGTGSALNPGITGVADNYLKFNYTNFVLDINSTSIAFANAGKYGKYEISLSSLNYGQWDEKDEQGNKLGTYNVNDLYGRLNWAGRISGNLYGGVNLIYGFSQLYNYTANYLTGGLGLIYLMEPGFVIGLSTTNNVITGKSYVKKEDLESLIVLGISKKLAHLPMRVGIDAIRTSKDRYVANLGGLLDLNKVYLTWGISTKRDDQSTEDAVVNLLAGLSGGLGVNFDVYSLSVGYRNLGGMGSIVSLSFNWKFSEVKHD